MGAVNIAVQRCATAQIGPLQANQITGISSVAKSKELSR
jgi:hypothetical protein